MKTLAQKLGDLRVAFLVWLLTLPLKHGWFDLSMKVYGINEKWSNAKKWRYEIAFRLQPALAAYSGNRICDHCKWVEWGFPHHYCYRETHRDQLIAATIENAPIYRVVEISYVIDGIHHEFQGAVVSEIGDTLGVEILEVYIGTGIKPGNRVWIPLSSAQVYSA